MKILIVEPFLNQSHQKWAESWQRFSRHDIRILSLPGRYWKWRMHGAAITLAQQLAQLEFTPDVVVASDMLDLSSFIAFTRERLTTARFVVYFHENQLTYPWSHKDADLPLQRDNHYKFINFTSALIADAVWFNSDYHRTAFLNALPAFLQQFPDYIPLDAIPRIEQKSSTLYLGMELRALDNYLVRPLTSHAPIIVWNHRWEYDKNPEAFFHTLYELQAQGIAFKLVVLGEKFRHSPPVFKEAHTRLKAHILHWGYAENAAAYAQWLWRADIAYTTAVQDYFGGSVVEAIYCECLPLLPHRLAYVEHLPQGDKSPYLYTSPEEATAKLANLCARIHTPTMATERARLRQHVSKYDWAKLIAKYDELPK